VLDVWLDTLEPLKRGAEASIFIGTARSTAKIQPADKTELLSGSGVARLRLTLPLVALGGDRFVLRGARVDGPAGAVIGGGVVLDARPPRQIRGAKRAELLKAIHLADATAVVKGLATEQKPRALRRDALPSRFSMAASTLESAAKQLVQQGVLVEAGAGWLLVEAQQAVRDKAVALVATHHETSPLDAGIKLQTLREQLIAQAGEEAASEALTQLTASGGLVVEGDIARLPSFKGAEQNEQAAKALASATDALRAAALGGLTENQLIEKLGVDVKQARSLTAAMSRRGDALRCGSLWFDAQAVSALEKTVLEHFGREPVLTIAQFKDMTGLGRKQSIPLLEHFDTTRVTKRQGSDRIKG
jgi:selenocysteine-specific elongation factor